MSAIMSGRIDVRAFDETNRERLQDFVQDMLRTWPQESSLDVARACCPDQGVEDLILGYHDASTGRGTLMLACSGEQVVGVSVLHDAAESTPWRYEWGMLNVHPDARRFGVARLLLASSLLAACDQGARSVFIRTSEDNTKVQALFGRFGGVVTSSAEARPTVEMTAWTTTVLRQRPELRGMLQADVGSLRFETTLLPDGIAAVSTSGACTARHLVMTVQ